MTLSVEIKYIGLISHRLRNFKRKNDYVWNFSCPLCGDSKKNPLKARGYVYKKGNNLFYSCKNCGAGTSIGKLIESMDGSLYKEYILERYKNGESGHTNVAKPTFIIPSPRFDKLDKEKVFEYAEWCDKLPDEHFCKVYLTKRQIPNNIYDKLLFTQHYKKFIDALVPNHGKKLVDDARLIIPFYDEYNNLIAVSGRALETSDKTLRYITIRTNDSEEKLVYGMDRLNIHDTVKIVEGPIDSLFLKNCVAAADANLIQVADKISAVNKVLIYDNESRNKDIVKMMQDAIKSEHNIVIWPDTIGAKDINEMVMSGISPDEIESIISSNTFKGLQAQVKFNMWKRL
jgi:transcription elongation factor Elf1